MTKIDIAYTGDSTYNSSNSYVWLVTQLPATISASATPAVVAQTAPIVYAANVGGFGIASTGDAQVASPAPNGTVAFFVDGEPVASCSAQPVSNSGVATCATSAPAVKGPHTLKTDFSGADGVGANSATAPFTVIGPEAGAESTDFGTLTVGETAKRTVTVTNTGGVALKIVAMSVDAPFKHAGDTCIDATIAAGATCAVELVYAPTAAGTHTGALTLEEQRRRDPGRAEGHRRRSRGARPAGVDARAAQGRHARPRHQGAPLGDRALRGQGRRLLGPGPGAPAQLPGQ